MSQGKEKAAERIREQIKYRVVKQEEERKTAAEKARQMQAKREADEADYQEWLKKHLPKARKAAHIIWRWYRNFVDSPIGKETMQVLKNRGEIRVSTIVTRTILSKEYLGNKITEKQMLVIDTSGDLYVHNCVKYGKSYRIHTEEELLTHVALPILIEIGKTIDDETIWDIIDF